MAVHTRHKLDIKMCAEMEIIMLENKQIYARVHSIESFGSADGPGVRFLVFLQGCNMRCKYCHNPDTWKLPGDDYDNLKTPEELLKQAKRYKSYWGKTGGITVSGGEALLQIDFLIEFLKLAKQDKNILDMAEYLSEQGKDMWIRHVLVPGINDDEKYLKRLYEFISKLKTVKKVEILPYHTLGVFKWKELGYKYSLEDVEPPTKEQVERAKEILHIK